MNFLVFIANNMISENMNKIVIRLLNIFNNTPDLKIKKINNIINTIYIVYLETICDSNKINNYILKNLTKKIFIKDVNKYIAAGNSIKINEKEIEDYLTKGFALVIKNKSIIAVEVRAELNRSIKESIREPSLTGPQDAFTENYQINLGLIKRRIKTTSLKTIELSIGKRSNTIVSVNYIDDIAKKDNVNNIINKLNIINTDGIIDAGDLTNYLDNNKSVFPTIRKTERPDVVANSLLEGKIIILLDTSPFAIILPTFLVDFLNPITDNYSKSINTIFIKLLRILSFILSIITPALFIAITNYNKETIPTSLLINFSIQESNTPFPTTIELFILLLICDILRESDLRFPSNFGSTISILGALIIGEAAVNAGIVSPIMIIIAAFTLISSLIFTDLEINNALRYYRYLFLILAAFLGFYGIFIATMIFLINVISLKSLDTFYFAPISPFNKEYFFKTVLKSKNDNKRSKLIAINDLTKG